MSLQVWLPFNGRSENQGIYNNLTYTGDITYNDNGKIGKCKSGGLTISADKNPMGLEGTIAFWLYVDENTSGGLIFGNNSIGASLDNRKWSLFLYPNRNSLHSWGCMLDDSTSSGNGSFTLNNIIPDDTWTHLAVAHDDTNQYIYINGELIQTIKWNILSGTITFDTLTYIVYPNNNILFNDFRIYDECLNQKQIRDLAKGMVAHYKLDKPIENLIKNSSFENGALYYYWYGVNSSSIRIEDIENRKCITGTKGTSNNLFGQTTEYVYDTVSSNVYLMFSADIYVEEDGDFQIGAWIANNGWQNIAASTHYKNNGANHFTVGWNRVKVIIRCYSTTYTGNVIIAMGYSGTTMWMHHPKLEVVKDQNETKATSWCPNRNDLEYINLGYINAVLKDSSGNDYNLKYSSTEPESDSDSTIYMTSSKFLQGLDDTQGGLYSCNQYLYREHFAFLNHAITFSCWVKQTSRASYSSGSSTGRQFIVSQGRDYEIYGFNLVVGNEYIQILCGTTDERIGIGSVLMDLDTWYHVAATWDGSTVKLYVNGVLSNSSPLTAVDYVYDSNAFVIGKMSYGYTTSNNYFPFVGNISDVRIYSTALSAEDILELYHTRAKLDKNGNYYGYELMEE